jgi:subtilisin family serine protease
MAAGPWSDTQAFSARVENAPCQLLSTHLRCDAVIAPRLLAVIAAAAGTLALAAPALAAELSSRPAYLPPPDGMAASQALRLAADGSQDLIVAVERGAQPRAILGAHNARDLGGGLWLVKGRETRQALRRLKSIGALRYAHPNGHAARAVGQATQGDPSDPAPWWMPRIGADRAVAPGPGFPLTIIDDGIDVTHPEFAARPVTYLNGNTAAAPDDFHGTMVGSIAAAPANGVGVTGLYPNANLRSVDSGAGSCAEVLVAIETAIRAGPSVINMSFGFTPPAGCLAIYDRLIQAFGTGSLPVASAGNSRAAGSPPGVPAVLPHVLTVGATNSADTVASFSNRDIGLDLVAPGENIVLAAPTFYDATGYSAESGTSFSAPLVSAAAAWVASARPRMHITQFMDLMRVGVRDVGQPGWDADHGFGILDLPTVLTRPVPGVDPQEPNDDVNQVKAGGLFRQATPPLTRPGRGRAALVASLDYTEDPVDVYRVFVPAKRTVYFTVTPNADVDLELFRPNARTVFYRNRRAALRGALIGGSYRNGRGVERFSVVNTGRRGGYVYACIFKPLAPQLAAVYRLGIRTRRR